MSIKNRTASLFVLALIVVCAILALRAQNKLPSQNKESSTPQNQQSEEFANQFPITDFTASEPANSEERARRKAVSKKYDDGFTPVNEYNAIITSHVHWAVDLKALPVEKSQVVIIGEILEAGAYLSNDKTTVYSEFNIRVDEVLKFNSNPKLTSGDSLIAQRSGGRVRYPSGHITLSFVNGQGMPIIGHRYVLFLAYDEEQTSLSILTGYEINGDRIALLDSPARHPITHFKGADKETFLSELRAAITRSSQNGTAR